LGMVSSSPSVAPTEIYNLPPQAAPSFTFAPTLDGSSSTNPAVHFRITALAFLFSLSGIIFTIILVHQSVIFLIKKRWRKDDVSKWELDRQQEEKRRLLEEIESGQRKPERGVQFDENDVNDQEARHLEPSWIRERDFSMQWEDFELTEANPPQGCKILIANPGHWVSGREEQGRGEEEEGRHNGKVAVGGETVGGVSGAGKSARVMRKNKRVRPNDSTPAALGQGSEVTVRTPYSSTAVPTPPIKYRPGRVLDADPRSGLYEIEFTDSEGGVVRAVPPHAIQPLAEFHS
jgi:hypothetical protein